MYTRTRITGLGLLAGAFGVVLSLSAWNNGIAATPGKSGSSGQVANNGRSDPEIHRALHTLHEARHELQHARHDFDGHREAALHAVDEAIKQLEVCLKTTRNGGSSSNSTTGSSGSASNASQWRQNHNRLSSGS
ncbi:MAG TPA: hypothetical protein VHX65_10880 [Pirellulales bacterium]|jgi:hypothetical protein|nr:hypothetical protein [Pirellulales bacterium]